MVSFETKRNGVDNNQTDNNELETAAFNQCFQRGYDVNEDETTRIIRTLLTSLPYVVWLYNQIHGGKLKKTNFILGLREKPLILILIISLPGGVYTIKRYKDHLDKKVVLLAQQQIEGHVHRKIIIKDKAFSAYHPESYVLDPINLKIAEPRMINFHGDVLFIGSSKGSDYRLFPRTRERLR